jgi:hypothetical protein
MSFSSTIPKSCRLFGQDHAQSKKSFEPARSEAARHSPISAKLSTAGLTGQALDRLAHGVPIPPTLRKNLDAVAQELGIVALS